MNISREGIEITNRFFEAIDMLKAQRVIRGLQTFTTLYGINRWNMNTTKWHPEKSVLKPEWIAIICRDFNISPTWIILGVGDMFRLKTHNFTIDEKALTVDIKTIESFVGKNATITYTPNERRRVASGTIKRIVFNSKKNVPSVEIKTNEGRITLISLYSIESMV